VNANVYVNEVLANTVVSFMQDNFPNTCIMTNKGLIFHIVVFNWCEQTQSTIVLLPKLFAFLNILSIYTLQRGIRNKHCLCLNHADSLISQLGDTAEGINISKVFPLVRQDVQSNKRPCPSNSGTGNEWYMAAQQNIHDSCHLSVCRILL